MKIKLDENVHGDVVGALTTQGHNVATAREQQVDQVLEQPALSIWLIVVGGSSHLKPLCTARPNVVGVLDREAHLDAAPLVGSTLLGVQPFKQRLRQIQRLRHLLPVSLGEEDPEAG